MTLPPNVHDAEPIPAAAREAIDALMQSGDLFRYTAKENAPVTLLEQEFAQLLGVKYALAVSSCSAALFLSLKALGLPRDARVLIPGFTFAAVPGHGPRGRGDHPHLADRRQDEETARAPV